MRADFLNIPATSMHVAVVFELMSWVEAKARCNKLHPMSHLVVIRSAEEYSALKIDLRKIPGNCNIYSLRFISF